VCQSQRVSAPAGVNICFRNLNNRPAVICISDNGPPYGSVDPCCAETLSVPILPCFSFISLPLKFSQVFSSSDSLPHIFSSTYHLSGLILLFLQTSLLSIHHPLNPGYDPSHRAVTQVTMAAEPGMPTLCSTLFPASDRKQ